MKRSKNKVESYREQEVRNYTGDKNSDLSDSEDELD